MREDLWVRFFLAAAARDDMNSGGHMLSTKCAGFADGALREYEKRFPAGLPGPYRSPAGLQDAFDTEVVAPLEVVAQLRAELAQLKQDRARDLDALTEANNRIVAMEQFRGVFRTRE